MMDAVKFSNDMLNKKQFDFFRGYNLFLEHVVL